MATSDKEMLQRARDISEKDIKKTNEGYEVTSQNPKNQQEVIYFVCKTDMLGWTCTCPNFVYSKVENYACKHIIRVTELILLGYFK